MPLIVKDRKMLFAMKDRKMLFAKVARICLQEGESQAELGGWVQLGPEERVLKVPQRAAWKGSPYWGYGKSALPASPGR
jgi:hypothetical protein